MPIKDFDINNIGQSGVFPTTLSILTEDDTFSDVMAIGYLNILKLKFNIPLSEYCMALVSINPNPLLGNIQLAWFNISKSGDNWSLSSPISLGEVILPTIANHIATYTNTTGTLSEDASIAINAGNIQAGLSGTAGAFISYPLVPNNGSLRLSASNAGGNFQTTISNGPMGQQTRYDIADIGASTGGLLVATTPLRMKFNTALSGGGTAAITFADAFCTTQSIIMGNWSQQSNPVNVLTINPQNGSFIVTSSGAPGTSSAFTYVIFK